MKPLVSILIPAYNAQEFIAEAIQSALDQTWPRKEVIVVDDGSKDQTLAIARQFASDSVKVVTHANQGAAATRNHASALSQGDYIQWLDADDLLAPDKIAKQLETAERCASRRMLLSSAWGSFFYRSHRAEFSPTVLWHDLSPVEWLIRKFETCQCMQTATWLTSRELTEAAGPWDTRLLSDDDGEYFTRVIAASEGSRFVPEAKIFYRKPSSGNLSYIGKSDRKMEAQMLSMRLNISHLRSLEDSDRVKAASVRYLQWWLMFLYPERPDIVNEAQELAGSLGGRLELPRLSWKYAWIKTMFGWPSAKRAQLQYNQLKLSLVRSWDKALFERGKRSLSTASGNRPSGRA